MKLDVPTASSNMREEESTNFSRVNKGYTECLDVCARERQLHFTSLI